MYLKDFKQMIKCCLFDIESGKGTDLQYVEDTKTSGFCFQGDFGWVAIYPKNGLLTIQINSDCWHLLSDDVVVDYFHSYDEKITHFKITDEITTFEFSYKSWWADRDDFEVNPIAASCEEENAEEDVFGYIKMLKNNENSANNLTKLWTKNLSA